MPWAAALLLIGAAPLGAQQSAMAPPLAPRPAQPAAMRFVFPAVALDSLPNGLRVVVVENHTLPVVAVRVVIAADSTQDPRTLPGLADVTQRAMGAASTRFSQSVLADTVAALGLTLADTSFTTRSANLRPALGIMADLLIRPVFSEAGVNAAKAAVLQSRRLVDNSTAAHAREVLYDVLFGADAAYNNRPTAASIASMQPRDIANFHARFYRPQRATVVLVGDVTVQQALHEVAAAFGDWSRGAASQGPSAGTQPSAGQSPVRDTPTTSTIYFVPRPGARQSTIVLGTLGPDRGTPSFAATSAFVAAFGGTVSSPFARILRQEHGWAYTAASRVDARGADEPTVLWNATDVAPEKTDSAIALSLAAVRGAAVADSLTPELMDAMKNIVVGAVQRSIATDAALASRIALLLDAGLPADYYVGYAAQVDAVTPADVARAGAAFENPEHLVIVVVGDPAVVETPLRGLGLPLTVVQPPA